MSDEAVRVVPLADMVYIKVTKVAERIGGSILVKPDETRDREQMAHDIGIMVRKGDMAFGDWVGRKPDIGETVVFDRYKGRLFEFRNEDDSGSRSITQYRLCGDSDVRGIVEEE